MRGASAGRGRRARNERSVATELELCHGDSASPVAGSAGGAEGRERAVARRLKRRHLGRRDRLARRHAARSRQRIDERAVLFHAIVKMRPGDEAGRADTPDQIALLHARAGPYGNGRQVQVLRFEAVGVPQLHHPPGGAIRARPDDHAVGDRDDRRANRRAIVDPQVRTGLSQDGMETAAREAGRDDRIELQRRLAA